MTHQASPLRASTLQCAAAFTLIEVMVVVALMAIVLTMGVPIIYKTWHKPPLTTAINDVVEVCSAARARAILQGAVTEVVFHPKEGRLEVAGGAAAPSGSEYSGGGVVQVSAPGLTSTHSAQFSEEVAIDMLDINLVENREADQAVVRFYPNGMCDEMTLVLRCLGEQRGVTLEITTSLPTILNEEDLQNLRK